MKKYILLALVAVSPAAFAASWNGSLDASDPTYNRTFEDGSGLSGVGTDVYYDVQPFFVTLTSNYTMEVSALNGATDTYAFIYDATFDPTNAVAGWVGGDDDYLDFSTSKIGEGEGTPGTLSLIGGVQYYAITTSFSNGDTFEYENVLRAEHGAAGDVRLGVVPEPGSMLALGAGLAALASRRRRK